MGELAAELGLSGEVDRDAYAAVLAGKHPVTGDVLVSRPEPRKFIDADGRERRLDPILGYDIRFAAPKSVSLLYAVGSPEVRAAILRAHDHAVVEAVGYLEQDRLLRAARQGRRGDRAGRGLPLDGLPPPLLAGRRPRPAHPPRHRQHDPRRLRRALAQPRQPAPPVAAAARGAKPPGYVYQAALRAELTRELGARVGAGRQRLRRPRRRSGGR